MSSRSSRSSSTRASPRKGVRPRRGRRSGAGDEIKEISVWPLQNEYDDGTMALDVEMSSATMQKTGCKRNDFVVIQSATSDELPLPPACPAVIARAVPSTTAPHGRIFLSAAALLSASLPHSTVVKAFPAQTDVLRQLPLAHRVTLQLLGDDAVKEDRSVNGYFKHQLAGRILQQGQYLDCLLQGLPCRMQITAATMAQSDVDVLADQLNATTLSDNTHLDISDEVNVRWSEQAFVATMATEYEIVSTVTGKSTSTSYQDIGGLEEEVAAVREVVDAPLRHPERFVRLGIQAPKGILLVGPPGTGKTLIARAVAHECNAHVVTLSAAELVSKVFGETETRLKAIFAEARAKHPSVIFMDEIDALCPARQAGQQHENRVVTVLLTLLDGIDNKADSARVVVIAATNRPDALDPALRRPGRFDRELEIGIPTAGKRAGILSVMLKHVRHNVAEGDIRKVAEQAHGYVGADLKAVVKEAGLCALKRMQESNSDDGCIIHDDLLKGLQAIRPSGMREVLVDVPQVRWSDVGGQHATKQQLIEAVDWPLSRQAAFAELNIQPPRGVLLYGPPGCSKTLMAKALATESKLNFIAIKGPELFSKYVGESERAVRTVFKRARAAAPAIIFFDEIDSLGAKRGQTMSSNVADRVLSQLLTEMDGIVRLGNVTILAATNRPDLVDPALLRPGRFDRRFYVGPPDAAARQHILAQSLGRLPCGADVDIHALVEATAGYSGAEVAALHREAALLAMGNDPEKATMVKQQHLLSAVSATRKSITPEMLQFYHDYSTKYNK